MDWLYHHMLKSSKYNIHLKGDPPLLEIVHRSSYYYMENFMVVEDDLPQRTISLWLADNWISRLMVNHQCKLRCIRNMSRIVNYIIALHGGEFTTCNHPTGQWHNVGLTEEIGNSLTFGLVVVRAACKNFNLHSDGVIVISELLRHDKALAEKFLYQYLVLSTSLTNLCLCNQEVELIYGIAATFYTNTYHNADRNVSKEGLNLRLLWRCCKFLIRSDKFAKFNQQRWESILNVIIKLLCMSRELYNAYDNYDSELVDQHKYTIMLIFSLIEERQQAVQMLAA